MKSIGNLEKYDRQLRLWATSGQSRLENAHVLVCQPTITSLELLKNLVLPGIGNFTILDTKHAVTEDDLAANFYLDDEDIGRDWTTAVVEKLGELNEDVNSSIIHVDDMASWWNSVDKSFWSNYSTVIIPYEYENALQDLYDLNVATIVINSIGFYGYMRVVTRDFEVVETHPETLLDLRVLEPWDELQEYCDSIDFAGMDVEHQSRVPSLIIQMKALDEWRRTHNGTIPTTAVEKEKFKNLIHSWRKEYGQANFDEAVDNARKVFIHNKVRSNVQDIFDRLPQHIDLNIKNDVTQFWVLVKSLKRFTETHDGYLPLKGELPDMDSSSEQYLVLQNVYRTKAHRDVEDFKQELAATLNELGLPAKSIPDDVVRGFVANASHLYYSTNSAVPLSSRNYSTVMSQSGSLEATLSLLAVVLIQRHVVEHGGVFPTADSLPELVDRAHGLTMLDDNARLTRVLSELLRSRGVELGNVAALMGGLGAQEAIKLVTRQYIPLDNTLVFDAIRSTTDKWKID